MINQVVVVGRLVEDPRIVAPPGQPPRAELLLELEHAERSSGEGGGGSGAERCQVLAHMEGERRAEVARRYFERGRHYLFHGHLRQDGGGLVIVADRFEFMENGLVRRALWQDPRLTEPSGAPPGRRGGAAPGPAVTAA